MQPRPDPAPLAAHSSAPAAPQGWAGLYRRPLLIVEDHLAARPPLHLGDPITLGLDRPGHRPALEPQAFDLLLTSAPDVPAPWISTRDIDLDTLALSQAAARNPIAASILVETLRLSAGRDFDAALWLESLAYSTVLGGAEFRRWRTERPARSYDQTDDLVRLERRDNCLTITLDDPTSRNALSAAMRDSLVDALTLPMVDPSIRSVILEGAGPVFCSGGHLDEFGASHDLALAHRIRTSQSVAHLVKALGSRLIIRVHGQAVGGGLEIAAASGRLEARPGTQFRLPEVGMGLIPGAGGVASLPFRIGRHRTAFLALTGRSIELETALTWGLVDALWGES